MCGIVGIAGEINQDLKKVFQQLLIVDQLRGTHSTGVMSVRNYDGKVKHTKVVGGPENFDDSKSFNDISTDFNRLLVGHNRFATTGKINLKNAHPFDFDTVIGVHNGSLRNYSQLPGYGEFDVDSQVLYNSINEIGLEDTLAKITGAYALVYWDKIEEEVVFIRNSERPLWMAFTENQKSFVWASELWMVEGITSRNGVKIQEPFLLKADTKVSLKLGTVREVLKLHVKQDVKGGAEVAVATNVVPFRYTPTGTGGTTTGTGTTESRATTSSGTSTTVVETNTQATSATTEVDTSHESPLGKRKLTFVCGMKGCDNNGAKFIHLTRGENDKHLYRLYLKREDFGKFHDKDVIEGDVATMIVSDGKCIYKIGNSSVRLLQMSTDFEKKAEDILHHRSAIMKAALANLLEDEKKEEPIVIDNELDEVGANDEDEVTYPDHNGKYLGKEAFLKKHQFCGYCTGNIDPDAGYRFIQDQILCDGCMVDKIIVDSLS